MIRQVELVEKVKSYDSNADEDALNRAYVFAMKAHGSQKRASGDPYFSHPLEVAGILTEYKLDYTSIITALLHDVIEDTDASLKNIEKNFGDEVSRLVDGVTKLTRIEFPSDHAKQAENFRKLLLAMSKDIRVLLIKLADRLHNMRTLHHIKSADRRHRIAVETMEIYAPLAERIGMQEVKNELEDMAFKELHPDARESIKKRLDFLRRQSGDIVHRTVSELDRIFAEAGIKATVLGREKRLYSIWRKMSRDNMAFEQLSDIMAFRVVVDTVDECYSALGIVHGAYPVVSDRFKDYISTPKQNGYRSLHTGIFGPERQRIEMQIRTREMHEIAENGVAAHWQYKQNVGNTDGPQYRWLRELLDILEHASGPEEFLEHTKLEMFDDLVFCFTPRGDLINLPSGATAVDFAYAVHSEIGDHCVGAKINGRIAPLRTPLINGQQVEIITSKAQTPSPTWQRFVVTGKARSRINRFIHSQERQEYLKLGRSILQRSFHEEGYEYTDKALKSVLNIFNVSSPEDLCAQVGSAHHSGRKVVEAVFPGIKKKDGNANVVPLSRARDKRSRGSAKSIPIKGLIDGMAMHFAGCCNPLPGDRIVGIITTGKGVTIHTIDCRILGTYSDTPERWLDVSWDKDNDASGVIHVGRIQMTVLNEPGCLGNLSMVIAKNNGNISNLKITNRSPDFFDLLVDIEVCDVKHLTNIIAALRATPVINTVERARG